MKKLKLKLDSIKDMLTKDEMKKIIGGGYGNYTCTIVCYYDSGPYEWWGVPMNSDCGGEAVLATCEFLGGDPDHGGCTC